LLNSFKINSIKIKRLTFKSPFLWSVHEKQNILLHFIVFLFKLLLANPSTLKVLNFCQVVFHQLWNQICVLSEFSLKIQTRTNLHYCFFHIFCHLVLNFYYFFVLCWGWYIFRTIEAIYFLSPIDNFIIHFIHYCLF
jgi:hypothetical protein